MIFILIFSYMYLSCYCLIYLALPSLKIVPLLLYPYQLNVDSHTREPRMILSFFLSPSLYNFSFPLTYSTRLLSCFKWIFIHLNDLRYKPADGKEDIFRIFNAANDIKSQLNWLIILCIYLRIYFRINYIYIYMKLYFYCILPI